MLTGAILRELRLYAGLPLFVFIVLVGSVASLFLFLVSYYVLIKGRALSATPVFVREGLVKFRWLVWLFITTDVFLISNHLLLRGLAVGIWDVDGYFYPYYVLVADYARAGRFVRWNPCQMVACPFWAIRRSVFFRRSISSLGSSPAVDPLVSFSTGC
jgi:hypothetical protein